MVFSIGLLALLFLPYSKKFGYSKILENCNRREWLFDRIFNNNEPIDIVLLGSSQMGCGIQDSIFQDLIKNRTGDDLETANLSFCRYGRSFHFAVFKDLLIHHKPKILILEVRENESRFCHPDFHFIADAQDLFGASVNQSYLNNLIKGAANRIDFQLNKAFGTLPDDDGSLTGSKYNSMLMYHVADSGFLSDKKQERQQKGKSERGFRWQYSYSKKYLNKIFTLAKNAGVEVYFLYFPSYGSAYNEPSEASFYKENGGLLIPPDSILENPSNWADDVHLNKDGSLLLTQYLSKNLFN